MSDNYNIGPVVPGLMRALTEQRDEARAELAALRARVAELERDARIGQLVRRRLADVTSEYGYATVSLRDLRDIDAEGGGNG